MGRAMQSNSANMKYCLIYIYSLKFYIFTHVSLSKEVLSNIYIYSLMFRSPRKYCLIYIYSLMFRSPRKYCLIYIYILSCFALQGSIV